MHRLVTFKVLFVLAALLLVAKPFFGFSLFSNNIRPVRSHNILAKSFIKRKPENLQEAQQTAAAISNQLANPAERLVLLIASFLSLIIPAVFDLIDLNFGRLKSHFLKIPPVEHTYLFTGKLII